MTLLEDVRRWAASEPDILGVALVGWCSRFGVVRSIAPETYGVVRSLRVIYDVGLEVEFGLTGREWAQVPLDAGTAAVLADGMQILHDPEGLLRRAAVSRS